MSSRSLKLKLHRALDYCGIDIDIVSVSRRKNKERDSERIAKGELMEKTHSKEKTLLSLLSLSTVIYTLQKTRICCRLRR